MDSQNHIHLFTAGIEFQKNVTQFIEKNGKDEDTIGATEAADFLDLRRDTILAYATKKIIPSYKINKEPRFKLSELKAWDNNGRPRQQNRKEVVNG